MKNRLSIAIISGVVLVFAAFSAAARTRVEFGIKGGIGLASLGTEATGWVSTIRGYDFDADYSDNFEASNRAGFQIGGFVTFDVSDDLAIQPEMMYVSKGLKVEGVGIYDLGDSHASHELSEEIKLTYLEVPVLVKYRIPLRGNLKPSLFAGPAVAINLSAGDDIVMTSETGDTTAIPRTTTGEPEIPNTRSTDLGLVFGGDLRIPAGPASIVVDIRYELGLNEPFEDINPESIPYIDHRAVTFPDEYPMAARQTGLAPDMKNRVLSITVGASVPI